MGGGRKYILCTNNENNICENVTYKRLRNIQSEVPHNLKYLKANFISKYSKDLLDIDIYSSLMKYIKELIELEYHIEIDNKKYVIVNFDNELEEKAKNISKNGKIFINSWVFVPTNILKILKNKNISIIEIPEYYYRKELKELGEI